VRPAGHPQHRAGAVVVVLIGVGWMLGRGSSSEPPPPPVAKPTAAPPAEDPRRAMAADFAAVDAELKTLAGRDAYSAALTFLAGARGRHLTPDWSRGIDARERRPNEDLEKLKR
jgi:hypothetical protein